MKRLLSGIILILLIMALSHTSQARVTGWCSNCHTMHNSQGGTSMIIGYGAGSEPCEVLLRANGCLGCHVVTDGASWQGVGDAPIVFNVNEPTFNTAKGLAGGNFYYVVTDGDTRGHNIVGIKSQDGTLGRTPPGGTALSSQLTCAGEYGCHGDRTAGNNDLDAIYKTHHADDTCVKPATYNDSEAGTTVAKSYRFLSGIKGIEDSDWEEDNINTSHNEYKGATSPTTGTISSLCAKCHGDFHSSTGVGSSSPWLRHPTDRVLKGSGEYASYTTYSMTAPVARPNLTALPASPNIVRPGTDTIMCLSCHRAHASPYYKMIRWNYRDWPGTIEPTGSKGCATCHTWKE